MNITEAIKFVKDNISQDDASMVFYAMRQEFGWAGTVFTEGDIRQSIADRREADDKEPYTDEQMDEAVTTVVDGDWNKWMKDWMNEQCWEYLNDLISDYLNNRGDN